MAWRVFVASACGSSHREDGRPCQDAAAYRVQGDALLAVVCDGAGSCEFSHIGAGLVSDAMAEELMQHAAAGTLTQHTEVEAFRTLVEGAIDRVRESLQSTAWASGLGLSVFATTLVGVVTWLERGYFFHIGDGYAVVRPCDTDYSDIISAPENGEYANETYFITGNAWREHLRITPLVTSVATVVLLSDGAASFVMAKGHRSLHDPFIVPVLRYLDGVLEVPGSAALAATLSDPRTDAITNDDKTLLIALWV